MTDEIAALKLKASELLADIRANVMKGDFTLAPQITNAIITDSAEERETMADLDTDDWIDRKLKEKGLNRRDRRAYVARLNQKTERKIPAHTLRAQRIVNARYLKKVGA